MVRLNSTLLFNYLFRYHNLRNKPAHSISFINLKERRGLCLYQQSKPVTISPISRLYPPSLHPISLDGESVRITHYLFLSHKWLLKAKTLEGAREGGRISGVSINNVGLGSLVNQESDEVRSHVVTALFPQYH